MIHAVKQYMCYVNCIFINSQTNYFMILILYLSPMQHSIQYIRKSIQTMYSISKYTFKLMKPVEICHHEIVLVSSSLIQINYSTIHKYMPMNMDLYE